MLAVQRVAAGVVDQVSEAVTEPAPVVVWGVKVMTGATCEKAGAVSSARAARSR